MRIGDLSDSYLLRNRLEQTGRSIGASISRLAKGTRIVTAADDPSGILIKNRMKSQMTGTSTAIENMQQASSALDIQQAGLNEIRDLVIKMRDLAVKSANDTVLTQSDRDKINIEMGQLNSTINDIARTTRFNGMTVLLGSPVTTTTDLEFMIEWNPDEDLDMHVIQPDGAHAWYNAINPNGHGTIDHDDQHGPGIEHYNVASGTALTGNYDLWVNYYADHGGGAFPCPVKITISMYRGTPLQSITVINTTVSYQAGDLPYLGGAAPPYGELHVGSYFWAPAAIPTISTIQAGADNSPMQQLSRIDPDSTPAAIGSSAASAADPASARSAITTLDATLKTLASYMSTSGTTQRILNSAIKDAYSANVDQANSLSLIQDTDYAAEVSRMTKEQIVQNTAVSMFSQMSNMNIERVKSLLKTTEVQ